jgi:pimeloyl-ACP methyl ester carboxylesterase
VGAVLGAVDASPGDRLLVVGHSAACSLAWAAAEARPERVARVVLIGGFPSADGELYADFFEPTDGAVPFPGWDPFAGADSDDLDDEARRAFESVAVPVPASVTKGVVHLTDERRFEVPVSVVCPEFSPEQARGWVEGGEVPELAKAKHVDFVDIESGHWPMFTRPAELARLLAAAAAD